VCISQIVNDLSTAAMVLPKSWSGSDAGRITRGAALALKGLAIERTVRCIYCIGII
jgi:hypothetical protein